MIFNGGTMKKKFIFRIAVLALTMAILLPSAFSASEMVASVVANLSIPDNAPFVMEGNYIKGIPDNITVSEFLSYFNESGTYITRQDGYRKADASRIGTGCKLITSSGEYTLIVEGDANGDTYISSKDIIRAKKLIESKTYTAAELAALDLNLDKVIDKNDISRLSNYVVDNVSTPALNDIPPVDLGDGFYATIDLSYTDNSLQACLDDNVIAVDKNQSDPSQLWRFSRNPDGSYYIKNVALGRVLDLAYASSEFGANVGVYTQGVTNNDNQQWFITEYNDGYILATKCAEDRVLDVSAGSTKNGTNIQIYGINYTASQVFKINKVDNVPSDIKEYSKRFTTVAYAETFYVNMKYASRSISVDASGNVCLQRSYPYWKFEYQTDGSYKITSTYNGKVLDVHEGIAQNSSNVQTYESNDSLAQRWFVCMRDGRAMICSAIDPNYVLDVYSGVDVENVNIHLYSMNSTDAQWFSLGDYTTTLPEYSVTCPYNNVIFGRYNSLGDAKAHATGYFGYVVRNQQGTIVYNPNPTLSAAKILYHAKLNADYARLNGYTYGDAMSNPALNKTEKVVSCDRFVGWTLYDAGYNRDNQPSTKGYTLYGPLENLLISLGFQKHTNLADVRPGDIIFVGTSQNLAVPSNYKSYPCHVFIAASYYESNGFSYRYDAGTQARLQSVQPSYEPLSYPNTQFRFAYRPQ